MTGITPLLAAAMVALTLGGAVRAAAEQEAAAVTVTPLQGPLYLMQGRGGNVVASVGKDGVLLVDDDYAPLAPAYHSALARVAGSGFATAFVINTHWHGDHTGGNAFWAGEGAVILAHGNVRRRMSTRQVMKGLGRVVEPSPAPALPVVTFDDSLALHFNGDDIEVQHYPRGHTDGDSVVFYSAQNVVHMGDLFFNGAFPFVDLSSGGDVFGYIANVEAVLAQVDDATVIVPGHGALADRADLERYHHMLVSTSERVRSAVERGMDLPSITAQGLGDEWQSWGNGFINEASWISFIVASLAVDKD